MKIIRGIRYFSAFKTEPFHVDLLCLLFLITIFAEDRRHSAM